MDFGFGFLNIDMGTAVGDGAGSRWIGVGMTRLLAGTSALGGSYPLPTLIIAQVDQAGSKPLRTCRGARIAGRYVRAKADKAASFPCNGLGTLPHDCEGHGRSAKLKTLVSPRIGSTVDNFPSGKESVRDVYTFPTDPHLLIADTELRIT